MKKFSVYSICCIILLAILACGGTPEITEESKQPVIEDTVVVTEDQEVASDVVDQTTQEAQNDSPLVESSTSEIVVEEQVVFDQEGIIITIKSLDLEDSFFGPELKLLIENNNEKDITVQVRKVSVNDIMIDPIFSADVATGKKINDGMTFMDSELEVAGITTIKEIEFIFHIFDAESWDDIIDSEVIHIETSVDKNFVQEIDDSGFLAVESNGIKIIVKKLDSQDSFWGADVYVYIENNSDQDVTVQTRDVSIDGFMVDPIFSSDVVSGKRAFDTITFMESDLEENGVTDINSLELRFHVFNMESWNTIFDSEIVSITFE